MKNLSKSELIEKVAQLESQISLLKNASSQTTEAIKDTILTENTLKEFVSQLPLAAALFSPNGSVLKFNKKAIALLGYTIDDIPTVEIHWPLFFPDPEYRLKVQEDWTEMLTQSAKTGIPIQPMLLDITCKNGKVKKLEVHSIQFGLNAITMWVDFTENLKREEMLKKQTEQLHSLSTELEIIIDNIPGLVFYKDTNNRFIRVNKFMSDAHKLSKNKLEGVSMFDIYPKEIAQAYFEDDLKVIQSKKPKLNIDEPWKTEAGLRWVNTSKIPNMDKDDNVIGIIGISMDVTERKKQEEKLKEAIATKDKFFSIISHDLRNPFNSILGFSDLLLENHKIYDEVERENIIRLVDNSAKNTFKLLENLLTWSRLQTGKIKCLPELLHLKLLLFEIMKELQGQAKNKNIQLIDNTSESDLIYADANMTKTVLRNLISNAIKFTNQEGCIKITSKKRHTSNKLEISVKDTGVGIPTEIIDNLFLINKNTSSHGTENEKGTGLGLILCKEFVEKHSGKIWVESVVGKGSDFKFTIPLHID